MLGPDVGRTTDEANAVDLKHLLEDGYPASSARVVAALARRCRDLQTALVQSTQQLDRANMAADGLQETNMRVLELSQVHTELEEERQAREKMRYTVSVSKSTFMQCCAPQLIIHFPHRGSGMWLMPKRQ